MAKFKYIVWDTETTGLPASYSDPCIKWPRLVQLGYVVVNHDGRVFAQGNPIIKPEGFVIPYEATKVHKITTEQALADGVELKKALEQFGKFWKECEFQICHNYDFDINILNGECVRVWGKPLFHLKPHVCTKKQTSDICKIKAKNSHGNGGWKWPKLEELHHHCFKTGFDNAHDGLADAAATHRCYEYLIEQGHKLPPRSTTTKF